MTVEAPRLFVVNEIRKHARIEFSPKPVRGAPLPAPADPAAKARVRARSSSTGGRRTAKLNPDSVREIRSMWAEGQSVSTIAVKFAVSKVAVQHVVTRRSWSDVV